MTDASTLDWTVFVLVVGLRLVVPLFIPRFPLQAILAALVIDGVDKSIFAAFTGLPLDNYQSYDKALDIYYLTIAYLSVLRNWRNPFAVGVAGSSTWLEPSLADRLPGLVTSVAETALVVVLCVLTLRGWHELLRRYRPPDAGLVSPTAR